MHRLLERQLKKYFGEGFKVPKEWQSFLAAVGETYFHWEEDRGLLERSLELSSKELMENNKKLAQEKARDEALLVSIGDGVMATDIRGRIILANQEAERLLGWKFSEIEGKVWDDVIVATEENGKIIPKKDRPFQKALKSGKKFTTTTVSNFYYIRKDGRAFPAASTANLIVADGKVIGVVNVFRDITLERDIDRAKTEFVSLASHQLRTPLSTVSWYAEMLLSGDAGQLTNGQKKYLKEVYQANRRMIELVNALLNVSRIDLGTFIIDVAPTNLGKVADSVLAELKPQIKERVVSVTKSYDKKLPMIPADAKLLRMVFQNLLSNAIKYTPPNGKVRLTIERKNPDILITVADTGYGIPASQQPKIFSKLFRADNVREKESSGTGLGLYIVESVVKQSGGKIWFDSEENKGSRFYVAIPIAGMKRKIGSKALG